MNNDPKRHINLVKTIVFQLAREPLRLGSAPWLIAKQSIPKFFPLPSSGRQIVLREEINLTSRRVEGSQDACINLFGQEKMWPRSGNAKTRWGWIAEHGGGTNSEKSLFAFVKWCFYNILFSRTLQCDSLQMWGMMNMINVVTSASISTVCLM